VGGGERWRGEGIRRGKGVGMGMADRRSKEEKARERVEESKGGAEGGGRG